MVEAGRRHGHYDPRFVPAGGVRRKSHLRLVPELHGEAIDAWEDEGGTSAPSPRGAPEPHRGLDWEAFSARFFPGGSRHDMPAVKAYEAYRATGAVPAARGPRGLPAVM